MISFQAFRQTDGTPIYLQIIRYIQQGLAAGTVRDGDELPSRRVVSALLAVNPNTVQKAFRLLEDEGLVTSRAGAKSFIQATPEQIAALRPGAAGNGDAGHGGRGPAHGPDPRGRPPPAGHTV